MERHQRAGGRCKPAADRPQRLWLPSRRAETADAAQALPFRRVKAEGSACQSGAGERRAAARNLSGTAEVQSGFRLKETLWDGPAFSLPSAARTHTGTRLRQPDFERRTSP